MSTTLIIGGIALILMDKWTERKKARYALPENVSYKSALLIGFVQSFSMVPGVSRIVAIGYCLS